MANVSLAASTTLRELVSASFSLGERYLFSCSLATVSLSSRANFPHEESKLSKGGTVGFQVWRGWRFQYLRSLPQRVLGDEKRISILANEDKV